MKEGRYKYWKDQPSKWRHTNPHVRPLCLCSSSRAGLYIALRLLPWQVFRIWSTTALPARRFQRSSWPFQSRKKKTLVDTRPFKSNDDQWHWIRVYRQTDRPEGVSPTQNETKPAPLVVRALWVFLEISSTIRILLSTGVVASISCGLSFSLQFSLTPQIIWRCWWSYHLR